MDAVTPKGTQTADAHSHLVRPQHGMAEDAVSRVRSQDLLFDRKTGLMTALMRFAPGAVLPDHEHVNIEQTYVLEGSLVDKEGPAQGIECKAGEFIWRKQGSRHVAWCPQGGLMLAIFQVRTSLRGRRPRHRRRGRGLGRGLGTYPKGLILFVPGAFPALPVIASAAKQSTSRHKERIDCLAASCGAVMVSV